MCLPARKGQWACSSAPIGIARARTKIGLANILYNMKRVLWLTVQTAGPDQKNPIAHQPSGADAPGSVPLVAEKPCQRPPYRQFLEVSNLKDES
jgi:hypothetical protein